MLTPDDVRLKRRGLIDALRKRRKDAAAEEFIDYAARHLSGDRVDWDEFLTGWLDKWHPHELRGIGRNYVLARLEALGWDVEERYTYQPRVAVVNTPSGPKSVAARDQRTGQVLRDKRRYIVRR